MSNKAILYYFEGRGKAEILRIALCVAGIEFEEKFIKTREDYLNYLKDNPESIYEQLPGLRLQSGGFYTQTGAVLAFLARTRGLTADDPQTQYRIDLLFEGTRDLYAPFLSFLFPGYEAARQRLEDKLIDKYLSIFDKELASSTSGFLVGDSVTLADIGLLECVLAIQDFYNERLQPHKNVQTFLSKMASLPGVALYLKNYRKKPNDENYIKEVDAAFARK